MKSLLLWIHGLYMDCVSFSADAFLQIMGTDMTFFETYVPIVTTLYDIIIAFGWALLIGNLVFQAMKSMMAGLGYESEDPAVLLMRTGVYGFLLLCSRQICGIALGIGQTMIEMLGIPSVTTITTPNESFFLESMGDGSWIMAIIVAQIVWFQMLKLLFVIGERYVVVCILTLCAPLGFAMGGSKATKDIASGYIRMFISAVLMLVVNVLFLKIVLSILSTLPTVYTVIPWLILVVATVRVAKKSDGIVARIGMNPAVTTVAQGRGAGGAIAMMMIVARSAISSAVSKGSGGSKTGGGNLSKAGGAKIGGSKNTNNSSNHANSQNTSNIQSQNSANNSSNNSQNNANNQRFGSGVNPKGQQNLQTSTASNTNRFTAGKNNQKVNANHNQNQGGNQMWNTPLQNKPAQNKPNTPKNNSISTQNNSNRFGVNNSVNGSSNSPQANANNSINASSMQNISGNHSSANKSSFVPNIGKNERAQKIADRFRANSGNNTIIEKGKNTGHSQSNGGNKANTVNPATVPNNGKNPSAVRNEVKNTGHSQSNGGNKAKTVNPAAVRNEGKNQNHAHSNGGNKAKTNTNNLTNVRDKGKTVPSVTHGTKIEGQNFGNKPIGNHSNSSNHGSPTPIDVQKSDVFNGKNETAQSDVPVIQSDNANE